MLYTYQLYQEAQIEQHYNSVKVYAPWIDIYTEIDQNFDEQSLLKNIAQFPICYIYPNKSSLFKGSYLISEKPDPYHLTKKLFKKKITPHQIQALKNINWNINLKKTLKQCHCHSKNKMFSSLHVYSLLRHWVEKNLQIKNKLNYIKKIHELKEKDENAYLYLIKKFLHLNYYITVKLHESMTSALKINLSTKEILQNYIDNQSFYPRTLIKTLNSFDKDIDQIPINFWIKISMDLLKLSSTYDIFFPAFIMLLEHFEDISIHPINPIAKVFYQHPKTCQVGNLIQKHHEKELKQNHYSITYSLLFNIPWITLDQTIACFRLTELLLMFINFYDQETLSEFKNLSPCK